jgi:glycerol-3-phosphate cytidylyltransferase
MTMTRVITFGSFDVFHVGHLLLLERARELGSHLIVGVSTDALNREKKGRDPIYPFVERQRIVAALRVVDETFAEESLELKRHYIVTMQADVLVMGDDWRGKFDMYNDVCRVEYLPRTPAISTTAIIERIKA